MINKKVKADHGTTNSHRHYSIPTKEHMNSNNVYIMSQADIERLGLNDGLIIEAPTREELLKHGKFDFGGMQPNQITINDIKYKSQKDAALDLGVSQGTITNLVKKYGNTFYFTRDDLKDTRFKKGCVSLFKQHTKETKEKMKVSSNKRWNKWREDNPDFEPKKYIPIGRENWKHADNTTSLNKKIIVCPHCKAKGNVGNMKRWHFENCKKK